MVQADWEVFSVNCEKRKNNYGKEKTFFFYSERNLLPVCIYTTGECFNDINQQKEGQKVKSRHIFFFGGVWDDITSARNVSFDQSLVSNNGELFSLIKT